METIKEHDFIEIDYVARIKDSNQIFDLTIEKVAKEHHFNEDHKHYGPVIMCIGENNIVRGIDKGLLGKTPGNYRLIIGMEDGFGKKNPKMIKLIASSVFIKQNINPIPGLQLEIDGTIGTIRSVSGGRCIVDFNHPLAGRELEYDITFIKKINDVKSKIKSMLNFVFFLHDHHFSVEESEGNVVIKLDIDQKVPENILNEFEKSAKALIPELKSIKFNQDKTTTAE